jgi:hypothetical protein
MNLTTDSAFKYYTYKNPKYLISLAVHIHEKIQVAARSKAWFFGRSLAGFAGSNPAGVMDVCFL